MDHIWLKTALERYQKSNYSTIEWILSRAPLSGGFLDTKVNCLTGESYTDASHLRGPKFTYGWIQGRGLESIIAFANFYSEVDPDLSRRLLIRAKDLFESLRLLYERNGHINFLYNANFQAIRIAESGIVKQSREGNLFVYADAFAAKGLFAAATIFAPKEVDLYRHYLFEVIEAIQDDRFQINENNPISRSFIAQESDDFAPRTILLGAAGLLHRHNYSSVTIFADNFIDYILENHYQTESSFLLNSLNNDICNVGHSIEFCGFALDHYTYQGEGNSQKLVKVIEILRKSLVTGIKDPGIPLFLSTKSGETSSKYFPWWPLPEAIRACALAQIFKPETELFNLWKQADEAFFKNYWIPGRGYAYQTRDKYGPVDYVPATPDLDPGYHTGLSLLKAIQIIRCHLLN